MAGAAGGLLETHVEIAPTCGRVQYSAISGGAWLDISSYVIGTAEVDRGTQHELQLPNSGKFTLQLDNSGSVAGNVAGALTPSGVAGWQANAASIVPDGVVEMPIRIYYLLGGVRHYRFSGYVSSWGPNKYSNGSWYIIDVTAYDQMKQDSDAYFPAFYLDQYLLNIGMTYLYDCNDTSTTMMTNKSIQNFWAYDSSGNNYYGKYGFVNDTYLTQSIGQSPAPVENLEANTMTCNTNGESVTSGATMTFGFLFTLDNSAAIQTFNPMLLAACSTLTNGWVICAVFNLANLAWYPQLRLYKNGALTSATSPVAIAVKNTQMIELVHTGGNYIMRFNGGAQGAIDTVAAGMGGAGTGSDVSLAGSNVTVPSPALDRKSVVGGK